MELINKLYEWLFPPLVTRQAIECHNCLHGTYHNVKSAHMLHTRYGRGYRRSIQIKSMWRGYREDPKFCMRCLMRFARITRIRSVTSYDEKYSRFPPTMFYFTRVDFVPRGYIPKYALGLRVFYSQYCSDYHLIKGVSDRAVDIYAANIHDRRRGYSNTIITLRRQIVKPTIWNARNTGYYY